MYFTTDRHERLRREVREFAEINVRPLIADMEASREVEHKLSRLIAAQGWIGVTIPCGYGGMGAGHIAKTIVIEELARVSGAAGAIVQASQLGVAKILHFGTPGQKRRWLPPIARGECLPTIAVTEEGSGGHVLGMEATAERDGDDWILNGHKIFVGNSRIGDVHGVVVRTGSGRKNLSAFLVESSRRGLELAPHQASLGLHGFSFGKIVFRDCRVPAANMLGKPGDGLDVAYASSVLYGRLNLAAVAVGIHRAVVEETVREASQRTRYGRPLADVDSVKQKIGRMKSRLMTAQQAVYAAASMLDQGIACDAELMHAKFVSAEGAIDSGLNAMEIYGAAGLSVDQPVERLLRDALHLRAPAGTSEIQLLRLAECALGTYKGQWSERFAATPVRGIAAN